MSDVPLARRLLESLLPQLPVDAANVVSQAIALMHRRPYAKPRAPERSAPVDAEVAAAIRAYVRAHPRMSEQDVALIFRTNPGRVSEALHGDR